MFSDRQYQNPQSTTQHSQELLNVEELGEETESKDFLLPKPANALNRPHKDPIYSMRLAGAIIALIVWTIISFVAGIAIGKLPRHGTLGTFESGFVEESVTSELPKCIVICKH